MKKISILSAALLPFLSMAHPGHGPVQDGMAHYILSPMHLLGILAIGIVGYGVYRWREKKV